MKETEKKKRRYEQETALKEAETESNRRKAILDVQAAASAAIRSTLPTEAVEKRGSGFESTDTENVSDSELLNVASDAANTSGGISSTPDKEECFEDPILPLSQVVQSLVQGELVWNPNLRV